MTFIDQASAKRGDIVRHIHTYGATGSIVDTTRQLVVGSHWLDLQPLGVEDRFASEQMKLTASHEIYPQPYIMASVKPGDFYRIAGQEYKIVEPSDYVTVGYFRALFGAQGAPSQAYQRRQAYAISSLGPGNYTFGSGLLASVPAFSTAPQLIEAVQTNALWTVTNITATGFTVVDLGVGAETGPSLTVYLWNDLGVTETDRFYVTGLTAGNYTFGSGPLAHIAAFSQTPDVIGAPRNTGWYWIQNPTQYGFTVADAGINEVPSISVLIRAKPTATERRWSFSGLGEGSYTFGSGALAGMPSGFVRAPMVLVQPNNSGRVFRPAVTTTGFTITWTGEGVEPSVQVMIQEV